MIVQSEDMQQEAIEVGTQKLGPFPCHIPSWSLEYELTRMCIAQEAMEKYTIEKVGISLNNSDSYPER